MLFVGLRKVSKASEQAIEFFLNIKVESIDLGQLIAAAIVLRVYQLLSRQREDISQQQYLDQFFAVSIDGRAKHNLVSKAKPNRRVSRRSPRSNGFQVARVERTG